MKTKPLPTLFILVCAFVLVFQTADATPAKPAAATSASVQVPRTGQRTCYAENGAVIDCAGSGQDGEYQAGAAWPNPRFELTYCTSAGPCTDQTADCDGNAATDVILDRLTGLMWTRSGSLLTASVPWETALSFANNLTLCGYSDWRLPNVLEQQSMINAEFSPYTYPYPEYNWLHEAGFVDVYTEFYWTSTAVPGQPGSYFTSRGMFGGTIQIEASSDYLDDWQDRAWPVRAGQNGTPDPTYPVNLWKTGQKTSILPRDDGDLQMGLAWPEPRFSVVQDDCVIDNMTGLMWPREIWKVDEYGYPEDTLDWPASLNRARNFILCGYDDWRLPNEWEMLSLIDFSQSAPALPQGHPFKNALFDSDYATSTSYPWWTDYLFFMNIEAGPTGWHIIDSLSKDPAWYYSMPVRGGILGEPLLPDLTINYNYGQPGSYLTITGNFFAPHDTLYMTINGVAVGEPISVTGKGDFKVSFDTKDADEGTYNVRVSADAPASPIMAQAGGPQASITFVLDETAPHYDWDGTQPVIMVPAGLATNPKPVFLPVVMKFTPANTAPLQPLAVESVLSFILSNEPPGRLVDTLIAEGHGGETLFQVLGYLKNQSNGIISDEFYNQVAAAPTGSEVFTATLGNYAGLEYAIEIAADGTAYIPYVTGINYISAPGFTTAPSQDGAFQFTYAQDAGHYIFTYSKNYGGGVIKDYYAFTIAWSERKPVYLPVVMK